MIKNKDFRNEVFFFGRFWFLELYDFRYIQLFYFISLRKL